MPLRVRIVGRVCQEDILDPLSEEKIIGIGDEITEELASRVQEAGIERAAILGISEGTSKSQVHKARMKLRRILSR